MCYNNYIINSKEIGNMKDILILNKVIYVRDIEDENEDDGGWEYEVEYYDSDDMLINIDDIVDSNDVRFIIKDDVVYDKDWNIIK